MRKKAVMVMQKFYHLSPGAVDHLEDDFRRCLSDQDPGVMEASLLLLHDMAAVSAIGTGGERERRERTVDRWSEFFGRV